MRLPVLRYDIELTVSDGVPTWIVRAGGQWASADSLGGFTHTPGAPYPLRVIAKALSEWAVTDHVDFGGEGDRKLRGILGGAFDAPSALVRGVA